ncbi:MAG: hypothetical protein ABSG25_08130 [Bryobacteraceae bacterium]
MLAALLCLILANAAHAPFWEAKAPADWTDDELEEMLTKSPWVEPAVAAKNSDDVLVWLATARPMRDAEAERDRRAAKNKAPIEDRDAEEYRDFVRENEGKYIVLALAIPNPDVLKDSREVERMEDRCTLKIGGKKYKMVGHFPPSASDPYLRLVFPRPVNPGDKKLHFELYVPSVNTNPYRQAEFTIQDLLYKGEPEM